MATSALVLILSILVLGGAIATLGDRIGTRVGKARLSLFNLRPKKTAVLVTILTGLMISASTLTILFATSKPLRTGVFQVDEIQRKLRTARRELDETVAQKQQTESELSKVAAQKQQTENELSLARTEQQAAQKRLDAINKSLAAALGRQAQTEAQLSKTERELKSVAASFEKTQQQLENVSGQAVNLRSEIQQLQGERQELIKQRDHVKAQITQLKGQVTQRDREIAKLDQAITERDREIATRDQALAELDRKISNLRNSIDQRDREIAKRDTALAQLDEEISARDQVIAQRETRLKEIEKQQAALEQEVADLEQYYQSYQALRQGNVALQRGQVLAFGVFRIVDPAAARQVIDQLLREANRTAMKATRPGNNNNNKMVNERVVQITQAQVDQLLNQIKDGRPYLVRIFSAGNYVQGEKDVQVFADATVNKIVFSGGDIIAATSADPSTMNDQQIRQQIDLLLGASQFRANRAGILNDTIQVGDGRITSLIRFIEKLKKFKQPIDLKAVVAEDTYLIGPLKLNLVVVQNGEVIFSM
ncbi:DUF3084 domain-containing protein [Trichocoleus sp. FACHB-832]|uniref:DUF3084 domain-containing protein n=1 Tax=Trichocoleus sp. FACHB-832 TaxID=2692875 RepID=UPI0016865291|nr:DUF3084 domain-containing protein [Trichocoleus sp. FACHB-832]MBD1906768.1 DUF3084 domain-containing protein [Trichocoleus sp. FACHB-832]